MSCPNFSFQNRCVLITDDDYEMGNYPEIGSWNDGDRNYPSTEIAESKDFKLVKVVITAGNYSDACLDYITTGKNIFDFLNYTNYLSGYNRQELIDEIQYFFPYASTRLINRTLKGCNKNREDYECKLEKALDDLNDKLLDIESKKADKMINRIKKAYGYRELRCDGVFSNGEAIYSFIK